MPTRKKSIRKLKFQKNVLPHAEGSCLVTMGQTKVLCTASLEDKVPFHAEEKGAGWVTAEYAMLPRSGEKRTPRNRAVSGGRSQEISRLVGRSLRAAVDLKCIPGISIIVDCDVIRADGGTRTASINGGFIALVLAFKKLWKVKKISRWPIKSLIGAISVGLSQRRLLVDMDYHDDQVADVDMNIVMNDQGKLIEVQGTAEGETFDVSDLNRMVSAAKRAIQFINATQRKCLGNLPR